jgi:hypothetical protein
MFRTRNVMTRILAPAVDPEWLADYMLAKKVTNKEEMP